MIHRISSGEWGGVPGDMKFESRDFVENLLAKVLFVLVLGWVLSGSAHAIQIGVTIFMYIKTSENWTIKIECVTYS